MKILALTCLLLVGCSDRPLNNTEIIDAYKQCHDAGLKGREIENGWTYRITEIQCTEQP